MLEKFSGRIFERENECKEETSQKYRNSDYQNLKKSFLLKSKLGIVIFEVEFSEGSHMVSFNVRHFHF